MLKSFLIIYECCPGRCFEIGVCQTVRILSGTDLDLPRTLALHIYGQRVKEGTKNLGPAGKSMGFRLQIHDLMCFCWFSCVFSEDVMAYLTKFLANYSMYFFLNKSFQTASKRVVNLQPYAPIISNYIIRGWFLFGGSDVSLHQSFLRISAEATLFQGEEESRFHRWRVRISDGETIGPWDAEMTRRIQRENLSGLHFRWLLQLCISSCNYEFTVYIYNIYSNVRYVYLRYSPYTWMIYARLSSPLTCSKQEPKNHKPGAYVCTKCIYIHTFTCVCWFCPILHKYFLLFAYQAFV